MRFDSSIFQTVLAISLALPSSFSMAQILASSDRARFVEPVPEKAPNPSFIRQETVDLNGAWRFATGDDPNQSYQRGKVRAAPLDQIIQVPFAPQSRKSGIGIKNIKADVFWYERDIVLPANWQGGLLHFEGVDHQADIFFNGKLVGTHTGGFDPFAIDVSKALGLGTPTANGVRHRISLRVKDSRTKRDQIVGKQERVENEGVIFYGNSSGIWKPVYMERVNRTYLRDLRIDANAKGEFLMKADVVGDREGRVRVTIRQAGETGPVLQQDYGFANGSVNIQGVLQKAKLWSTAEPNLYFVDLEVLDSTGDVVDTVKSYTGFRTFEQRDGYFHENGKPYQLRGLLNQAIYPDSLYTPTEDETLRDFTYTKEAGFNGERRHQTTPTKRDQWNADRLGLWMAIELPSARNLVDKSARAAALREWQQIVKSYAYNPSVYFLVPGNEDWGFLRDTDHWTRATAKDREDYELASYRATVEVAPSRMLVAPGDGWRVITALKNGQPVPGLDPTRLMNNLHDYRAGSEMIKKYGHLPVFTVPGTQIPANQKQPFHENGYQYDGVTPLVLSEMGGRAYTSSENASVFAYGKLHTDPMNWGRALGNIISSMKYAKVIRGGYVVTQTRDAGNDPKDPDSGGELNGILKADGTEKLPASFFRELNLGVEQSWRSSIQEYQLAAREYATADGRARLVDAERKRVAVLNAFDQTETGRRAKAIESQKIRELTASYEEKNRARRLRERARIREENLRQLAIRNHQFTCGDLFH